MTPFARRWTRAGTEVSSLSTAQPNDRFSYRCVVRAIARTVTVIAVVALSTVSPSEAALAKNAPGSIKWCKHHPNSTLPACQQSRTGGAGASVTVSPNPIVETGDSDVYALVSVAVDPVYAEQTVEIVTTLGNRCGGGVTWITNQGTFSGSTATATIDNDGNATFTVLGGSCAAGSVQVIADVLTGTHPSYTTIFTIEPPAPLI